MTHSHTHDHDHQPGPDLNDLLELDAVVLADYWDEVLSWVADAAADGARLVVDLGTGVGTGALGLSSRLPEAQVLAVDISAAALERLDAKAARLGLGPRIRTVQADIDSSWPDFGLIDVTWVSMAIHHFSDPDLVLQAVRSSTRPGGLLAVAEFSEFIRFLPRDLGIGRPGFEDRVTAALRLANHHAVPELGSEWPPRVEAAGWRVLAHRDFEIDLPPPQSADARAYACGWFERLASSSSIALEADDRATLMELLDASSPHSLARREDLRITGTRSVTLATRDESPAEEELA